jgi:arylsulfatase A-like enzyme
MRFLLFISCAILIAAWHPLSHGQQGDSGTKPNIIFVLVDNLGYGDIGCFGSTKHRTPHIDRLGEEGIRLTSFYSSAPVCTPSRASFLTGCYPRRVGLHVDYNGTQVLMAVSSRGLNPDEITLPEILREEGYATACFGKWHLGDQPPFLPLHHGFDEFFGLPYSEDMGERDAWEFRVAAPPLPLIEGDTVIEAPPDPGLLTGRFTKRAVEFIAENKDRPFFLYLPHTMPGSTRTSFASEAFRGKSANGTYGDSVEELDWSMGEILRALDENGIDDRTLVIWTSDNGPTEKKGVPHGSIAPLKGWGYSTGEGGMRMPFVARWPAGIPVGIVSDEVTTAMDLLPTLVSLAGGEVPSDSEIDGHDILPILSGEPGAESPHEAFFYYFLGQLQAVRSGRWKLYLPLDEKWDRRRWRNNKGEPSPLELLDLDADIGEAKNLAQAHPEVVERLTALAEQAREELGDIGRKGTGQRPAGHYPNPRPLWLNKAQSFPE